MKKNILRKGSILLLLVALFTPAFVKAAEESKNKACITHKNYYLYLLPKTVPDFVNDVYKSDQSTTEIYTGAYFPMIPTVVEGTVIDGRICLSKDGKADGQGAQCVNGKGITWTLEEYYDKMIIVSNESKKITFEDENGTTRRTGLYKVEAERENGNKVIEYYYGGSQWFTCNDANCANITPSNEGTDVSSLSIAKLVTGTYLPKITNITFNPATSSKTTINRTINVKDFLDYIEYDEEGNPKAKDDGSGDIVINEESKKVVPFPNPKQGATGTILLAPAAYYVEYQTCGDYYTATINYYYYQNGDKTEDRVEFDDETVKNPYVEDYLSAGDSIEKASPELDGCVIVDTNGKKYDKDKTVTLTIDAENPENVEKNVYYYCKALDEGKPTNTGDTLIYIVWAIGLGTIGYSVYCFKNLKKEEI